MNIKKCMRPRIKSRHPSHSFLRPQYKKLPLFSFKSIIRFGSLTDMKDSITNGGDRVELNTIDAIKNSMNKLRMKFCFLHGNIKTADWWKYSTEDKTFFKLTSDKNIYIQDIFFPIISKHIYGSKGTGNQKHNNTESLKKWLKSHSKNIDNYIFEKFHNYNREYRLHITEEGCFYACRKMLRTDAPKNKRWYRNDDNSVWIVEENDSFNKPVNWNEAVKESVKALKSVGLDFGAIDLRIQSSTNSEGNKRKNPKFIIIEINSAPGLGSVGEKKYLEMLPKILIRKYEQKEK